MRELQSKPSTINSRKGDPELPRTIKGKDRREGEDPGRNKKNK